MPRLFVDFSLYWRSKSQQLDRNRLDNTFAASKHGYFMTFTLIPSGIFCKCSAVPPFVCANFVTCCLASATRWKCQENRLYGSLSSARMSFLIIFLCLIAISNCLLPPVYSPFSDIHFIMADIFGDGLLRTHVTWDDLQEKLKEVFGDKAILGPNKTAINIGEGRVSIRLKFIKNRVSRDLLQKFV